MRSQSRPSSSRISSVCSAKAGRRPGVRCGDVELHRVGDQFELARLHDVFVGPDLGVLGRLQRVLHRRPRPGQRGEALAPLRQGTLRHRLLEDLDGRLRCSRRSTRRSRTAGRRPARRGPCACTRRPRTWSAASSRRRCSGRRRSGTAPTSGLIGEPCTPGGQASSPLVEVVGQRDGVAHRPQPAAEQRDVDHRRFAGALALEQRRGDAAGEVGAGDGVAVGRARAGRSCPACPAG